MSWREIRPTAHFRLQEALISAEHPELAVGDPSPEQLAGMVKLAVGILEPVRMAYGTVQVNSWWRPPALNTAVGGAATSQHLDGYAADIEVPGADLAVVFRFVEHLDHAWQVRGGGGRDHPLPRAQCLVSQAILYVRGSVLRFLHLAAIDLAHETKGSAWQWGVDRGTGARLVGRAQIAQPGWRP